MAVKTFTQGEKLTAADTNTYLANAGLDYITAASATSGSALSINNCFTSTWTSYRVIIHSSIISSGEAALLMRLRVGGVDSSTGNYYWGAAGYYSSGTSADDYGAGQTYWSVGYIRNTATSVTVFDIINPALATNTMANGNYQYYVGSASAFGVRWFGATHNVGTAYDGFTLSTSGTITDLKVAIYGYRKA